MKSLISSHPYTLWMDRGPVHPFYWTKDISPHKAEGRDDGFVYLAGFQTLDEAKAWGEKRLGIAP